MSDPPELDPDVRRAARRRYALMALVLALILLGGGWALETGSRTFGEELIGYGIGVLVAACFLAAGRAPKRRR